MGNGFGIELGKTLATEAATEGLGIGLDMLTANWRQQKQLEQQQKLTDMQAKAQMGLSRDNAKVALQMWKDTNYSAQVEEMKKAGLNVGLMYGKGGSGGTTTSSPGSIGGATAQMPELNKNSGMGIQMAQAAANLELIKAQTNKTNAEAANIGEGGVQNKGWILDNIIKEFEGKDKKQYFEEVSSPLRGVQAAAQEAEYNQAIAQGDVIYDLWAEGKLKDKADGEIESILLNNAKNEQEKLKVKQQIENLKAELKGTTIDNAMKEIELKWQNGTGFKSQNISEFASKILGGLILGRKK